MEHLIGVGTTCVWGHHVTGASSPTKPVVTSCCSRQAWCRYGQGCLLAQALIIRPYKHSDSIFFYIVWTNSVIYARTQCVTELTVDHSGIACTHQLSHDLYVYIYGRETSPGTVSVLQWTFWIILQDMHGFQCWLYTSTNWFLPDDINSNMIVWWSFNVYFCGSNSSYWTFSNIDLFSCCDCCMHRFEFSPLRTSRQFSMHYNYSILLYHSIIRTSNLTQYWWYQNHRYHNYLLAIWATVVIVQIPHQRPPSGTKERVRPAFGKKQYDNVKNNAQHSGSGSKSSMGGGYTQNYGTITASGLNALQNKKW